MAAETGDRNSQQVEKELDRRPPAPMTVQPPGHGPEMAEAVAEAAGGGGGVAGPPVVTSSYPGLQDMSVHLAPPGFTVCESFFDSGVFTCFNPEVVFGTETELLPEGSFSMGDDVWCNVAVKDGRIAYAELATSPDGEATVSVHIADIRPDGVKQYHVGAVVVSSSSSAGADGISVEVRDLCGTGGGTGAPKDVLALKGWHGESPDGCSGPDPVAGSKFLEMAVLGRTGPACHIPSRDRSDGSMVYQEVEHGLTGTTDTLAQMLGPTDDGGGYVDGDEYEVIVAHDNRLMRAKVGNLETLGITGMTGPDVAEAALDSGTDYEILVRDGGKVRKQNLGVVPVDDSSIEIKSLGGRKKLQVKGWDTSSPAVETTLAEILQDRDGTAPGTLLVRGAAGVRYLPIGRLTGMTGPQSVIIDIQYDVSSHQIQVKRAKLSGAIQVTDVDTAWSMITGGQAVQHTSDS